MGKPLFPLRPSGAQKPLSDGSDGDIRGGTLQQNQGHLDMPTESFSCTQEKTIFEDQKIAQGRAGWEPETFLEPAFGKSVTAHVSCAGADAPRGLGGNVNFPAVLCTMGKPLFPLRPSGAQKPLSDGSDGDIRGGTYQMEKENFL